MRCEDAQTRIVERAEERERVPLGCFRAEVTTLREVVERRLVPVVPVGDVHALVAEGGGDTRDGPLLVDPFEPVALRADRGFSGSFARGLAERAHEPIVVGEHPEHGTGVRACRAQQLEAVGFRFRERQLMRQHHAFALRIQTERAEDAAPHETPARHLELVLVEVERVPVIAAEDTTADPIREVLPGARVLVVGPVRGELDADEIVRTPRVEALARRIVDDVVGRTDEIGERCSGGRVVANSAERDELGHVSILGPRSQ